MIPQGVGQHLPIFSFKATLGEKARLTRAITTRGIEQIIGDLFIVDDHPIKIRQFHAVALSTMLISSGVNS